jgi:hypothetical protein
VDGTWRVRTRVYRVLAGKPQEKRTLGRYRRKWKDAVEIYLNDIGWVGGVDWIDLARDMDRWPALVNVAMNIWVS